MFLHKNDLKTLTFHILTRKLEEPVIHQNKSVNQERGNKSKMKGNDRMKGKKDALTQNPKWTG